MKFLIASILLSLVGAQEYLLTGFSDALGYDVDGCYQDNPVLESILVDDSVASIFTRTPGVSGSRGPVMRAQVIPNGEETTDDDYKKYYMVLAYQDGLLCDGIWPQSSLVDIVAFNDDPHSAYDPVGENWYSSKDGNIDRITNLISIVEGCGDDAGDTFYSWTDDDVDSYSMERYSSILDDISFDISIEPDASSCVTSSFLTLGKLSTGEIVGITFGCIFGIVLIGLFVFSILKMNKSNIVFDEKVGTKQSHVTGDTSGTGETKEDSVESGDPPTPPLLENKDIPVYYRIFVNLNDWGKKIFRR